MTKSEETLLDGLLELAGKHARMMLVSMKFKELRPSWVLLNDQREFQVVGMSWKDDEDKRRQVGILRREMREQHVVAYSFVAEAWAVTLDSLDEIDLEKGTVKDIADKPVNRPDRREVVSAIAATRDSAKCAQWDIRRGPLGDVTELVPVELDASQGSASWLAELLR